METIYSTKSLAYTLCSYPTYEEWKLTKFFDKLGIVSCSYPTYEEWKLSICSPLTSKVSFSSYPTYEEWKRP